MKSVTGRGQRRGSATRTAGSSSSRSVRGLLARHRAGAIGGHRRAAALARRASRSTSSHGVPCFPAGTLTEPASCIRSGARAVLAFSLSILELSRPDPPMCGSLLYVIEDTLVRARVRTQSAGNEGRQARRTINTGAALRRAGPEAMQTWRGGSPARTSKSGCSRVGHAPRHSRLHAGSFAAARPHDSTRHDQRASRTSNQPKSPRGRPARMTKTADSAVSGA